MNKEMFAELVLKCAEHASAPDLKALLTELQEAGNPIPEETGAELNLIWEKWGDQMPGTAATEFVLETGLLPLPENPLFRETLAAAIKESLPPYLNRTSFIRAIGLRQEKIPMLELVRRFRKLLQFKSGLMLFLVNSSRWGTIGNLDSINGTVSMSPFGGGGTVALPLENVLTDAVLFTPGVELLKLIAVDRKLGSAEFRAIAHRKAMTPLSDNAMRKMAMAGCARGMQPEAFEAWWTATAGPAAVATRKSCNSRGLKEMELLLQKESETGAGHFSSEEIVGFGNFFDNLKPEHAAREPKQLAGVIAMLAPRANGNELAAMLESLQSKATFWPAEPDKVELSTISVWGELPVKSLEALSQVTAEIFPPEYLVRCAARLPLKALNSLCVRIPNDLFNDYFRDCRHCGCDLLLWIWKNRKKEGAGLVGLLKFDNVIRALSAETLPKVWGAAQRELRGLFLDNADFQKQLIASEHDDPVSIASELQGALFLQHGERQSLLVKLSRLSTALRDHIENGAATRILRAGESGDAKSATPAANEPNYTSKQSHKRLMDELDHLINVLVPENREALKTARAHGDFRENSEFDAAKERRNFLSRRRGELERELNHVVPLIIGSITVGGTAVIGSKVELEYQDDHSKEIQYLLGAWDGNPEKHYLSYKTRLGQTIFGKKVGDVLDLPGGRRAKITAIEALPKEVLAELD